MYKILSISDFLGLTADRFPKPLSLFVSELYEGLCAEHNGDENPESLFLTMNAIYVFEPGDQFLKIFGSQPYGLEYVEKWKISGLQLYRIGCMQDNECFDQYVAYSDWLDSVSLAMLDELSGEGWFS
jgi:hypothetical protein